MTGPRFRVGLSSATESDVNDVDVVRKEAELGGDSLENEDDDEYGGGGEKGCCVGCGGGGGGSLLLSRIGPGGWDTGD